MPTRITPLMALSLLWSAAQAYEPDFYGAPEQVAGATTIRVEQGKALHDSGAPFVDVRNPRLYARRYIPGAVHLGLYDNFNLADLEAVAKPDEPMVFYCSGERCSRSSQAAAWAVEWGHSRAYYFRDGVVAWRDEGLPLDGAEVD